MLCNDTWWISWSGRGCRWKQLWRNTDPAKLCETNAAEMPNGKHMSLALPRCSHSIASSAIIPSTFMYLSQPAFQVPISHRRGCRLWALGLPGLVEEGVEPSAASARHQVFTSQCSHLLLLQVVLQVIQLISWEPLLLVTKGHPNILAWKSRRHILPVQSAHDTSQMANRTRKDHGIESACHVMNGEYHECNGNAVDLHEWHRFVLQFELQMRWSSNLPVVKPRTRNHSREISTPWETAEVLLLKSSGALLCRQSACPRESRRWWRLCARQEEPGRVGHGDCLTMPAKLASSGPMTSALCASQTPWPRPPPRRHGHGWDGGSGGTAWAQHQNDFRMTHKVTSEGLQLHFSSWPCEQIGILKVMICGDLWQLCPLHMSNAAPASQSGHPDTFRPFCIWLLDVSKTLPLCFAQKHFLYCIYLGRRVNRMKPHETPSLLYVRILKRCSGTISFSLHTVFLLHAYPNTISSYSEPSYPSWKQRQPGLEDLFHEAEITWSSRHCSFSIQGLLISGAYYGTSCKFITKETGVALSQHIQRPPKTTSLSAVPLCRSQVNLWKDQRRPEMAIRTEKTRNGQRAGISWHINPQLTIGRFGSSPSSSKSSSTEDLRLEDQAGQRWNHWLGHTFGLN